PDAAWFDRQAVSNTLPASAVGQVIKLWMRLARAQFGCQRAGARWPCRPPSDQALGAPDAGGARSAARSATRGARQSPGVAARPGLLRVGHLWLGTLVTACSRTPHTPQRRGAIKVSQAKV